MRYEQQRGHKKNAYAYYESFFIRYDRIRVKIVRKFFVVNCFAHKLAPWNKHKIYNCHHQAYARDNSRISYKIAERVSQRSSYDYIRRISAHRRRSPEICTENLCQNHRNRIERKEPPKFRGNCCQK